MQRHTASLKSMEQKHHLACPVFPETDSKRALVFEEQRLKAAEQKIARALEKHRLDLEMKYKNEAEAWRSLALLQNCLTSYKAGKNSR